MFGAGTFMDIMIHIIKFGFFAQDNKKMLKLDLTKYFQQFETYLNQKVFGNHLNEIQNKYDIFTRWIEELADPDLGPTDMKYRERSVFMIEKQIDLASVQFMETKSVDSGLAAYYFFEPLLQQALLHQNIMLMHVCIFKLLGDDQEALAHFGRAKVRYDEYRLRLNDMQRELLKWRLDRIQVANTSFMELKYDTKRLARKLCKARWSNASGYKYDRHTISVEYAWEDKHTAYHRSQHLSLTRLFETKYFGKDKCDWLGEWSDGRNMLKEPIVYIENLSSEILRHTNELLKILDAAWMRMPGPDCLDDFKLSVAEDVITFQCQSVKDELLARRLKQKFGALRQEGFWPGQQPVVSAERYLICQKSDDPSIPVHSGNVCVKFLSWPS